MKSAKVLCRRQWHGTRSIRQPTTGLQFLHPRVKEDPDFKYLSARVAFLEESRKKTRVTLNESERRQERESIEQSLLAMENTRREALGKEPYKDYAELKSAEKNEEDDMQNDSELKETGEILTDWLTEKGEPKGHFSNILKKTATLNEQ